MSEKVPSSCLLFIQACREPDLAVNSPKQAESLFVTLFSLLFRHVQLIATSHIIPCQISTLNQNRKRKTKSIDRQIFLHAGYQLSLQTNLSYNLFSGLSHLKSHSPYVYTVKRSLKELLSILSEYH